MALLIDGENLPADRATDILRQAQTFGDLSVRRVYGNFADGKLAAWNAILCQHGLVGIHQHAQTSTKNAADIALVIDAMDLLHSGRYDGFVLVSGDSDFTRLALRLREAGLRVYGIGLNQTATALKAACHEFMTITPPAVPKPVPKLVPHMVAIPKLDPKIPLLAEAAARIERALPDSSDPTKITLSALGKALRQQSGGFELKKYGHATLKKLVIGTGRFAIDGAGLRIKAPGS